MTNTFAAGRSASRFAKLALLASAALLMGGHVAQAADADKDTEVSEVVVTGTSIRGVAPVGSSMTSVTQEEIKASPGLGIVQVLQKNPAIFNIGVSDSSRGQTGGSSNITYGSSINIRGISPYATLTLIDGHRMVPQEARAEVVDPQHIPTNMVQRVEIVADGGSAIYGSEAVAGVANLILRRRVEGLEVGARYGASALSYQEFTAHVTGGKVWDTGQFTAGVEYLKRGTFPQGKLSYDTRDQVPLGGTDIRSTNCQPGNVTIGTTNYPIPAGGVTPATANRLVAGPLNHCEPFKFADALPVQERKSFAMTFDQDITDKLHFNAEAYASKRNFKLVTVATALNVTVPSTNPYFVSPVGVTVPACSAAVNATYGTPAGTRCETVLYNFINDAGTNNALYGYSLVYEGTAGLKYDLPKQWQASLDLTYGQNQENNYDRSYVRTSAANLNAALASSDPTKALNVFGGPNNPAIISNTSPTGIFNQLFDTAGHVNIVVANAKVDGPVFTLPGGEIRAALGLQWEEFKWWSNNRTGPLTAPIIAAPQHADRVFKSYFAEVNVPIIGPNNQLPLVKAFELNAAGRIDDYSDLGRTKNPKFGFKYTPVDGLVIHGSYGTSFRSPNILDLYQISSNINVVQLADPKAPVPNSLVQAITLSGGNPGIQPETAKTYSIGGEFNPTFLPGLTLSANYFRLDIAGQIIAVLSDSTILSKEAQFAGTSVITRVTNIQQVESILAVKTVTSGTLPADHTLIKAIIDGRPQNLGRTYAAGWDFTASYRIKTDAHGDGVVGMTGELFTRYEDQSQITTPLTDRLNTIFYPPKWRARYYAGWNYENWAGTATLNYVNEYTNTLIVPNQNVKATTTTDLHINYDVRADNFLKDVSIGLDIQNVFDQDPPRVLGQGTGVIGTGGTSNFGGAGYDPTKGFILGRVFTVSIDKKF